MGLSLITYALAETSMAVQTINAVRAWLAGAIPAPGPASGPPGGQMA